MGWCGLQSFSVFSISPLFFPLWSFWRSLFSFLWVGLVFLWKILAERHTCWRAEARNEFRVNNTVIDKDFPYCTVKIKVIIHPIKFLLHSTNMNSISEGIKLFVLRFNLCPRFYLVSRTIIGRINKVQTLKQPSLPNDRKT